MPSCVCSKLTIQKTIDNNDLRLPWQPVSFAIPTIMNVLEAWSEKECNSLEYGYQFIMTNFSIGDWKALCTKAAPEKNLNTRDRGQFWLCV